MFQIVYENTKIWPEEGPFVVEAPAVSAEIAVSPDSARRRVNGYLVRDVSMMLHATSPLLILGDRPVWRLSIELRLPDIDHIATLGSVDVDAMTRDVAPLSATEIRKIRDKVNNLIARLSPEAAETI